MERKSWKGESVGCAGHIISEPLLPMTQTLVYPLSIAPLSKSLLPMAVLSKPGWSALPEELERMVFLLANRKQHNLVNYILVARRVKTW